jgi:hypothetical protein
MTVVNGRNESILRARAAVEKKYGTNPGDRKWLVGVAPDSYSDKSYRTEVHVLEGSPPKGYVIVFGHNGGGRTIAFDCGEQIIHKWSYRE